MPPDDIPFLLQAIRAKWGCEAMHVESVPITEKFQGQIAWDGTVEVFSLDWRPAARLCYAWAYEDSGTRKAMMVLHGPPVDSAQTAVKVAIAAKARET